MPKVNDQVNAGTEHHGVPSFETKPSPELNAAPCVLELDELAFESKQADRGYTVRATYLKSPKGDALIEIFKDDKPLRAFLFPAYKVWNIAAHFKVARGAIKWPRGTESATPCSTYQREKRAQQPYARGMFWDRTFIKGFEIALAKVNAPKQEK